MLISVTLRKGGEAKNLSELIGCFSCYLRPNHYLITGFYLICFSTPYSSPYLLSSVVRFNVAGVLFIFVWVTWKHVVRDTWHWGIQSRTANAMVWMNYMITVRVTRLSAVAHGVTSPVEDRRTDWVTHRERERRNWIVTKCAHLPLCLCESLQASAFEYKLWSVDLVTQAHTHTHSYVHACTHSSVFGLCIVTLHVLYMQAAMSLYA